MSQQYFQLGGFRPHVQWFQSTYEDKRLADAIVGSESPLRVAQKSYEPVELILGITRHGSSHLLLTAQQARKFERLSRLPYPRNRPLIADDFASLSPIAFNSVEELVKKLAFFKPKAKGKKSGGPGDSSQANRGYTDGIENPYRGAFEHGRVIFRILGDTLRETPDTYGCGPTSWTQDLSISSLVFNTKGVDDRPASERMRNPHVLDIGFCNVVLPAITPDYRTATHIVHSGNILLRKQGEKKPFRYGERETESISAEMLPSRIQALFQGQKSPMILLVNREDETLNFLRNMGVDVSQWRYGLRGLLFAPTSNSQSNGTRDSRYHGSRSRSPSPPRILHEGYNSRSHTLSDNRDNYNRRPPSYASVYVLDVQQLYTKLMQALDAPGVVDIARRLEVPVDNGWCAGNEAPLLIDIWRSMISGPPIDDQRDLRMGGAAPDVAEAHAASDPTPGPSGSAMPSSDGPGGEGSDSEDSEEDPNAYDPNAHKQNQNQGQAQKAPEAASGPYQNFEDQSDYGSDSSEDSA